MRVIVELGRCQGHGRCYDLAPDVFEPDERGHVDMTVHGDLPAVLESDTRIGVHNCPESALRLISDAGDGLRNDYRHAEQADRLTKLVAVKSTS
jgi:ferredoxin